MGIAAYWECILRMSRGLEVCVCVCVIILGLQYDALVDVAQAAARTARAVLFAPTVSDP